MSTSMILSRTFRVLFVGTLATAMVLALVVTGWAVWPVWRTRHAAQTLVRAVRANDPNGVDQAIATVKAMHMGSRAISEIMEMSKDDTLPTRRMVISWLTSFGKDAAPGL